MSDEILILGLDPSCNSSGVCIINQNRTIIHTESINPYPLDSISRLNYIYERVLNVLNSYDIRVVGFEKQINQQRYNYSAGSILPLAEVLGVYKLALYKVSTVKPMDIYAFKSTVLKESLSGNSKADKDLMMESVGVRRLNHIKTNIIEYAVNDVADAYSAADAALKVYEGKFNLDYDTIFRTT